MKLSLLIRAVVLANLLLATSALADSPDPNNSTATTAGGGIMACPAADGQSMTSAGTTVFVNLLDALGTPCVDYAKEWVWLADLPGDIFECQTGPGTHPASNTDINGDAQITGSLGTAGWTQSGLQVYLGQRQSRFPLAGPLLPIDINSPDITGDGLVDLADWNEFGIDLGSGFAFRSDFNHDNLVNISDIGIMAGHSCHSCQYFIPLSAVTAQGSIGIFFDTDGPPYTERTLTATVGVPFDFFVVMEGVPGMSAVDAPLRNTAGVVIINLTAIGGFGGIDPILYGTNCLDASGQTVIEQGIAAVVAPGPQVISFGSPATACNGMPATAYVPCTPAPEKVPALGGGFNKVRTSTRGVINGVLSVADPVNSVVTMTGNCCVMACPAGDGDKLSDRGCGLSVAVVDVFGQPVVGLNGSDFEVDGVVPSEIADCQYQAPGFVESPPGTYTFDGRLSAGGQTQNGLFVKVQGVTPTASGTGSIQVVSPDISGDGMVNLVDLGSFAEDLFDSPPTSDDWRSDLDCSGADLPLDVGQFAAHLAHGGCVLDPFDKAPVEPTARIYLSFDAEDRIDHREIGVGSTFTFHVLAEGMESVSAWEARVVLPEGILVTGRTLPHEESVNAGTHDEWFVGLGRRHDVDRGASMLLATYEAVVTEQLTPGAQIAIAATDEKRSSLGGSYPAWVDGSTASLKAFDPEDGSISLTAKPAPDDAPEIVQAKTELLGAAPNPFNPLTDIRFRLRNPGDATVQIFDLAGRRVRTIEKRSLGAGVHEFRWNGKDDRGVVVASGVYVVRLETADGSDVKRVALLK